MLEVNNYFISGLEESEIDLWFLGSMPSFAPEELGIREHEESIAHALQRAYNAAKDPNWLEWQAVRSPRDRNLKHELIGLTEHHSK